MSIPQVAQELSNDFGFGDEGNDAELTAAVGADQRVGEVDPPNELSPTFSESGALSGRELGLQECRGVAGTERLKC